MARAALFQGVFQLAQQLALVLGELDRRLHGDVAVQVAGVAGAHAFDALAAQAELFAGLGAFGDVDGRLARECGHFDLATERRRDEAHRHLAMQVIAIALEDVVLSQPDLDVQIARWPAIGAMLAIAGAADAHAAVGAGGKPDFQRLLLFDLALAVAGHAGLGNDLARAAAVRAGLLHAEDALAHLHRAAARAGAAHLGAGAGFGAAAVAGVTAFPGRDADLRILAARGLLEADFHRVAQVAAPVDLAPAAPASALLAEHVAEDVAKSLGKTAKAFRARAARAAHVRVHPGVAVLVVGSALLRVGEHLVGLLGFLEFLFGRLGRAALVAVRVVLHRQFAISLLDFFIRGVLGNAEDFVKVSFGHGHSEPGWSRNAAQAPPWVSRGGSRQQGLLSLS